MKGYFSYDSDFVSQRERIAISTQTDISFFFALWCNHGVNCSDFGVVKTFESFLNLTL